MLAAATEQVPEWNRYDDFRGDHLDERRWSYLTLPQPDKEDWQCFSPEAVTTFGEGTLDIHVQRFARTHPSVQVLDNLKHQLVSTETFSTQDGISVAFEMAATSVGDTSADFRDGFASFMLVDQETGWSFSICSNGSKDFGLYDSLRRTYRTRVSTNVIDAPSPAIRLVGNSRRHVATVSSSEHLLEWRVDGQVVCGMTGIEIPPRMNICVGLATMRSLDEPASIRDYTSGMSVSFGPMDIWSHGPD